MDVAVIGAGGWGTALAIQAAKKERVVLWSALEDEASLFREKRENTIYLPGVSIPESIEITSDIKRVVSCGMWVFVPPSKFFRSVAKQFSEFSDKDKVIVTATKGLEYPTEKRMSEILREVIPVFKDVIVLSGPSHAEEVSRNIPTSVVAAAENEEAAKVVQEAFSNDSFRVYTNDDVLGVEVCAAVKNVIAVAAGVLRGLGFGDNTMAALVTRGLAEIKRMGQKLGAREATFAGLAGMGDLIVTCTSKHSRNGRVGEQLAQGMKIEEILGATKMVAEGVETVKTVMKIAEELDIPMPISESVYNVIYNNADVKTEIRNLMLRPLKSEYL